MPVRFGSRCSQAPEVRPNFSVVIGDKDRPKRIFAGAVQAVLSKRKEHQLEPRNPKADREFKSPPLQQRGTANHL
jgi:hypothetical protein